MEWWCPPATSWRMVRKRPCKICHHWFQPDPRIGDRQHACSKPECQSSRRRKKQAAWRAANADYFYARRVTERGAQVTSPSGGSDGVGAPPPPLRMPRPLDRLPWDLAQSQFGVQGADLLGIFGRLLLGPAQSQRRSQVLDTSKESGGVLPDGAKAQTRAVAASRP